MGMHDMSRRSKAEYIKVRRERYEVANPAKKSRIIDEVMETTGFTRKYVINLLNGKVEYRERKGRGKTYDDGTRPVLAAIWREAGCPCTPYFKAEIERWVDEYEQYVANIAPTVKSAILAMSDSTMGRMNAQGPAADQAGLHEVQQPLGAEQSADGRDPLSFGRRDHGMPRSARRRPGRHVRTRRRRSLRQLLLDPRRDRQENSVDRA